jgi:hypothetical protein
LQVRRAPVVDGGVDGDDEADQHDERQREADDRPPGNP